jgi:hypothetical protein
MKHNKTSSMNKSESLSLVPGPKTVTFVIAAYITTYPLTSSAPYGGYRPV